jgi:hypothetical protein
VDDDIFNKTVFSHSSHRKERRIGTELIVVRAKKGQQSEEKEISRGLGPGNSTKDGVQAKQKDHHSLWTPTCAQSYILSLTHPIIPRSPYVRRLRRQEGLEEGATGETRQPHCCQAEEGFSPAGIWNRSFKIICLIYVYDRSGFLCQYTVGN